MSNEFAELAKRAKGIAGVAENMHPQQLVPQEMVGKLSKIVVDLCERLEKAEKPDDK